MKPRHLLLAATLAVPAGGILLISAGEASAHDIVVTEGECVDQTSAVVHFGATNMGDGLRTTTVTLLGESGSTTVNVNGPFDVTVSGFAPATGIQTATWVSEAVTPQGTPDVIIDFGPCTPPPEKKVFVCKYVGTPHVDERLQTGDNPISVSVNSIPDPEGDGVHIGDVFSDEHDHSIVIAFDEGQPEPDVSECPGPEGPPPPVRVVLPTPSFFNGTCTEAPSAVIPEGIEGEFTVTRDGLIGFGNTVTVTFNGIGNVELVGQRVWEFTFGARLSEEVCNPQTTTTTTTMPGVPTQNSFPPDTGVTTTTVVPVVSTTATTVPFVAPTTVAPPPTVPVSTLPKTGGDATSGKTWAALLLVGLGAVLVAVARRRSSSWT